MLRFNPFTSHTVKAMLLLTGMGLASCTDTIEPEPGIEPTGDSDVFGFEWVLSPAGGSRSAEATTMPEDDDRIRQAIAMEGDADEPRFLYLSVTDRNEPERLAAERAIKASAGRSSRGTEVTSDNYHIYYRSVGVTGICFNNDWEENDDHVYYLNNERVTRGFADETSADKYLWRPQLNYYWSGISTQRIRFFTYAPYSAETVVFNTDKVREGEAAEFEFSTETDVLKQVDLSGDAITCPGNMYRTVPLQMHHLLSQIQFSIGDPMLAGTIHKITIKGVKGKGTFRFNGNTNVLSDRNDNPASVRSYSPGEWTDQHDPMEFVLEDEIPLPGDMRDPSEKGDLEHFDDGCTLGPWYSDSNFDENGNPKPITSGKWNFFFIPQKLTDDVVVEIEMTLEGTSVPLVYRAKLNSSTGTVNGQGAMTEWKQGHKYNYMISTDVLVQYYLYFNGTDYAKYFRNRDEVAQGQTPLPWDSLYFKPSYPAAQVDGFVESFAIFTQGHSEDGSVIQQRENLPWHPVYVERLADGTFRELDTKPDWVTFTEGADMKGHLFVERQPGFHNNSRHIKMRNATPVGTKEAPYDLAMASGVMTTANTYIINAPGWYSFPLVYGNAITDGVANPASWSVDAAPQPTSLPAAGYDMSLMMPTLQDHRGLPITGPYIPAQYRGGIKVLWQNGYNLVDPDSLSIENDRVRFYVSPLTIGQGNCVISLTDPDGTSAWAWHLWFTDYNPYMPDAVTAATNDKGEFFDFMNVNLGWHYPEPDVDDDLDREVYVSARQHRHTSEDKGNLNQPVNDNKSQFYTKTLTAYKDKDENGADIVVRPFLRIRQEGYEATRSGVAPFWQWGRPMPSAIMPHTRFDQNIPHSQFNKAYARRIFNIQSRTVEIKTQNNRRITHYPEPTAVAKKVDPMQEFNEGLQHPEYLYFWTLYDFKDYEDSTGPWNSAAIGLCWWGNKESDPTKGAPSKSDRAGEGGNVMYWNLWSMTNDGRASSMASEGDNVVKTIYDPSPAGFTVPPHRAYKGFSSKDMYDCDPYDSHPEDGFGYHFRVAGGVLFFPAMGWLVENYPWTELSYGLTEWPYRNFGGELMMHSASAMPYTGGGKGSVCGSYHIQYSEGIVVNYTSSAIWGQPIRCIREKR